MMDRTDGKLRDGNRERESKSIPNLHLLASCTVLIEALNWYSICKTNTNIARARIYAKHNPLNWWYDHKLVFHHMLWYHLFPFSQFHLYASPILVLSFSHIYLYISMSLTNSITILLSARANCVSVCLYRVILWLFYEFIYLLRVPILISTVWIYSHEFILATEPVIKMICGNMMKITAITTTTNHSCKHFLSNTLIKVCESISNTSLKREFACHTCITCAVVPVCFGKHNLIFYILCSSATPPPSMEFI